jgi:hypothetical protein
MKTTLPKIFPSAEVLIKYLSPMLNLKEGSLEIISRQSFLEASTFPVEIVICKIENGEQVNLFCKYLGGLGPNNYGHRGGVEYESKIYEEIISRIPSSKIKFYGQCWISETSETLMVIEYMGEALRMLYSGEPDAVNKAAAWIGNFHRHFEGYNSDFIKVYDTDYFKIWSDRFRNLNKTHHLNQPWLNELADYFDDNTALMVKQPVTVIHGEYYPKNILLKDGIIYPVDWESAAIAPGEIDLASLIEGWENEMAIRIIETYIKHRWPDGNFNETDFKKRILMSQVYFYFWWWPENVNDKNLTASEPFEKLYHLFKETRLS